MARLRDERAAIEGVEYMGPAEIERRVNSWPDLLAALAEIADLDTGMGEPWADIACRAIAKALDRDTGKGGA